MDTKISYHVTLKITKVLHLVYTVYIRIIPSYYLRILDFNQQVGHTLTKVWKVYRDLLFYLRR